MEHNAKNMQNYMAKKFYNVKFYTQILYLGKGKNEELPLLLTYKH